MSPYTVWKVLVYSSVRKIYWLPLGSHRKRDIFHSFNGIMLRDYFAFYTFFVAFLCIFNCKYGFLCVFSCEIMIFSDFTHTMENDDFFGFTLSMKNVDFFVLAFFCGNQQFILFFLPIFIIKICDFIVLHFASTKNKEYSPFLPSICRKQRVPCIFFLDRRQFSHIMCGNHPFIPCLPRNQWYIFAIKQ